MTTRTENWLYLTVNPEPWAIGPVGYSRRGGKMSAYVGRNQQLAAFQEAVREEVAEQWGDRLMIPSGINISLAFWFWRQRAEYTTPKAKVHRKHEADSTNMQKACEDALQGIVFENDRDVREIRTVQMAQDSDTVGRIVIRVRAARRDQYEHEFDRLPPEVRAKFIQHADENTSAFPLDNSWPPKADTF